MRIISTVRDGEYVPRQDDKMPSYIPTYEDALRFHETLVGSSAGLQAQHRKDLEKSFGNSAIEASTNMQSILRSAELAGMNVGWNVEEAFSAITSRAIPALTKRGVKNLLDIARRASTIYVSTKTQEAAASNPRDEFPLDTQIPFDPGYYVMAMPFVVGAEANPDAMNIGNYVFGAKGSYMMDSFLVWTDPVNEREGDAGNRWWMAQFLNLDRFITLDWGERYEEMVRTFQETKGVFGSMLLQSLGTFRTGSKIDHRGEYGPEGRFAMSVLSQLADPGQRMSVVGTPRHARKSAKRAGLKDGDVHVLYRPSERNRVFVASDGTDATTRRHIVRGHWRRQPYGPIEAVPRPWKWRYIEEHERGSGPLIEVQKVHRS